MKISTLFGAAALLLATTALAHDLTYMGPIKSKETKTVRVELPSNSKLSVEVFSTYDTKFNCQFSSSYGGIVFEQTNTDRCVTSVNVTSESSMSVSVTNLGKDADYRIWVHDARQ